MKTILVPTDFSEVARNAAKYAIALTADIHAKKIVFYNAYQAPPVLTETAVPAMPLMDIDTMKEISDQGMRLFQKSMQQDYPEGVEIVNKTAFSILSNDINDICKETGADLIVMGISGTSKIEEALIGSTALSVMKHTTVPVIIVPAHAKYTSIKKVMLTCDYKKVVATTPVQPIKNILDITGAKLYVVTVAENDKPITADKTFEQEMLQSLLKEYNPEFHFLNNHDFIAGINHFAADNGIDLIITIPRKHTFFEGLFKERHSKKLAFHSPVPLMCVHEEDL